jgi:2-keto-4-pentenoate hydratase/2-oxohepta-3-ene-1,7-dioic acid hydratase in catechol pathway
MKLVTFHKNNEENSGARIGAVLPDGHTIADLQAGMLAMIGEKSLFFTDMMTLIQSGREAIDMAQKVLEFISRQTPPETVCDQKNVTLLAPVPRPASIRDCMSFKQHIVQATRTVAKWKFPPVAVIDRLVEKISGRSLIAPPRVWHERPLYYKSNPFSVVGPDADILWPAYTEKLDYELEFGIFIGRAGRDIPKKRAGEHIAGYTIFNDFSARDIQLREMQGRLGPAKGKDFDTGNAMGPWFVTSDEIPNPYDLEMVARINGEEWSRGNSRDMHFTFEDMIAYISQNETLHPGEFIGSGTAGNGCGLELDRWLQPGDTIELEVAGLGTLRNVIIRENNNP